MFLRFSDFLLLIYDRTLLIWLINSVRHFTCTIGIRLVTLKVSSLFRITGSLSNAAFLIFLYLICTGDWCEFLRIFRVRRLLNLWMTSVLLNWWSLGSITSWCTKVILCWSLNWLLHIDIDWIRIMLILLLFLFYILVILLLHLFLLIYWFLLLILFLNYEFRVEQNHSFVHYF